jgi:hypothetical protein
MAEKELLCRAAADLNTVRCRGHQHICLVEIPEDNFIAEWIFCEFLNHF